MPANSSITLGKDRRVGTSLSPFLHLDIVEPQLAETFEHDESMVFQHFRQLIGGRAEQCSVLFGHLAVSLAAAERGSPVAAGL